MNRLANWIITFVLQADPKDWQDAQKRSLLLFGPIIGISGSAIAFLVSLSYWADLGKAIVAAIGVGAVIYSLWAMLNGNVAMILTLLGVVKYTRSKKLPD